MKRWKNNNIVEEKDFDLKRLLFRVEKRSWSEEIISWESWRNLLRIML